VGNVQTTSTVGNALGWPVVSSIERNIKTGELWAMTQTNTTTVTFYRSQDAGTSWTSMGSHSRTGLYDPGEIRIGEDGEMLHWVYLINESSTDKVLYKRIDIRSGGFTIAGEHLMASGPAASASNLYVGVSMVPVRNSDGSWHVIVAAGFHGTNSGIFFYCSTVKNAAGGFATSANNSLIYNRQYMASGYNDPSISVSLDHEHNGDGISTSKPNIWACAQIGLTMVLVKLQHSGFKSGWRGPSYYTVVQSGFNVGNRDCPGRWDGKRFVIAQNNPADTSKISVYERNQANSATTTRATPAAPGALGSGAISYNHVTQDLRIFSTLLSSGVVYYVDYIRATNTWSSWVAVSATATRTSEFSVRRSTAGTNQYDFVQLQNASSPYTTAHIAVPVNFSPTAPTWITGTAGTVRTNGAAFDVSSSLLLDWQHNDPNTNDIPTAYALSRQIGVAAVQYWRASDSTWQAAEVQNSSSATALTLTTGQWLGGGGAADPAHTYRVKSWDAGGLPSAYSGNLGVIPSTRVDPTLTAPTPAQVLNTAGVTATWTVSEQSAYRITLTNTATGALVTGGDSGFLPDSVGASILSYTVPVTLPDGFAGTLTLQTRNAEGLNSVVRTVNFTVDFTEPVVAVISALAAAPQSGGNNVTVTQGAVVGAQPATFMVDLWRRVVSTVTPTNSNPYFETNTTDWTNSNFTSIARSTAQFHQGAASLLMTPSGASATPLARTTTIYPVTAGAAFEFRAWVRPTTANKTVRLYLEWLNASNTIIATSTRDITAIAGTWLYATVAAGQPDPLAVGVRAAVGMLATPGVGDTLYADELVLLPYNSDAGIRIAQDVVLGSTILDWRAVAGVNYEYRPIAYGENGSVSYGPWTA
jgi:hypothetical protein